MNLDHYLFLYPSYAVALLGWLLYQRFSNYSKASLEQKLRFKKPWLEFLFSILAAILTILIGQLYMGGLLIPKSGSLDFIAESINQIIIFSPFAILLFIRKHPLSTAWIPPDDKLKSLAIGLVLGLFGIITYMLLSGNNDIVVELLNIYSYQNLPELVQVFAEDFAISVCLVRLSAWTGAKSSIYVIAFLFALGHVPAMLSEGFDWHVGISLLFDVVLGVAVLGFVMRSRNFLWFWMVHYAMDMTQFIK